VQHAVTGDGRSVAGAVLAAVRAENAAALAQGAPLGSVGAVVGATIGDVAARLGVDLAVGGPLLAPGIGAQGATAEDLCAVFGAARALVLPSSSREVLRGGPSPAGLRSAADRTRNEMTAALTG
jgi:orotidine-5'-phosphate decarboxylase